MDEQNAAAQDNTNAAEVETNTDSASIENEQHNTNTSETNENSTESLETGIESKTLGIEEKPPGAPEKYEDFTIPEGFNTPIEQFSEFAKTNNWTQEQAQAAVDFYIKDVAPQIQAQAQEQHEAQIAKWVEESTTKYGKQGIEAANNALGRFSTPEFKQFLADTGLGSHPEMIGIFHAINSKISESNFVDSSSKPNAPKRLYPNSPDMYK